MKLYEILARDIEESIRTGVLRAGDRLPSVRRTSISRKVSSSTVFQAYYRLEALGLIRARERSGYFVTPAHGQPRRARVIATEQATVDNRDTSPVLQMLHSMMSRGVVPFGSALPAPTLFPLRRLGVDIAAAARSLEPWSTVNELVPGRLELRRQIAARYAADGMQVDPDEIVITNGALEGLNLCLATLARPGDAVIVESPCFYGALHALKRLGVRPIEIPVDPIQGIDVLALESAILSHGPKACWFMPTFHNPLGSSMPEGNKRDVVRLLAQYEIPLIEDDVYGELHFSDRRPPPAKAFDDIGLVLHCSSFSKSLAPGYRVGWVAAGQFRQALARQKLTASLHTSVVAQQGIANYLASGSFDRHLRKLRRALARQQLEIVQAVGEYFPSGTSVGRSTGGYFTWVELPPYADALELYRRAFDQRISIAPGPIFSASGHGFTNCIRLNTGHPYDSKAERALKTLGRLATNA